VASYETFIFNTGLNWIFIFCFTHRLSSHHEIFNCLSKVIVGGITKTNDKDYCNMVSYAMVAIFKVCDRPGLLISSILKNLLHELNINEEELDKTLTPTRNASRASQSARNSLTPTAKTCGSESSQLTQKPELSISQVCAYVTNT
jgi:hypothetical protein